MDCFTKINQMELLPIKQFLEENKVFEANPLCKEWLHISVEFYKKAGYMEPWICYYVQKENEIVGGAAFKGQPANGKVEIAYGTFEPYRKQGIATEVCHMLINLSLKTDPTVKITARTLPQYNYSTQILKKNSFTLVGTVDDPEDGEVWEWEYITNIKTN